MAVNFDVNVRLSYVNTLQAYRFANSALNTLNSVTIPPNPVRVTRYEDALDDLMDAIDLFHFIGVEVPNDPVFPNDPVLPPNANVRNQVLIRLSETRTLLAINRTSDAIRYIHVAQALLPETDITPIVELIENKQVAARTALDAALDIPPFAPED